MELHSVCSVSWQTCAPYPSDNASNYLDAVVKHLAFALGVVKALPKVAILMMCLVVSGIAILLEVFILSKIRRIL